MRGAAQQRHGYLHVVVVHTVSATAGGRREEELGPADELGAEACLDKLTSAAYAHIRRRLADSSQPKLRTAMRHMARFERRVRAKRPELFLVLDQAGSQAALLHNEWSLILFVEWLAAWRSGKRRTPLAVDTIAEYASMVKQELSVLFGFALAGLPTRLPAVIKGLRRERPKADRRKRRGIRRSHLRAAWKASSSIRGDDVDAANLWAAATTAWQGLARGAEVAASGAGGRMSTDERNRLPSRADLTFGEAHGRRFAQVMMRPAKRTNGERGEKVPLLFEEGDGGGSDTYAALVRMVRLDPVRHHLGTSEGGRQRAERATPLFRVGGKTLRTERLRRFARQIMRKAGQGMARVGAHSFRIGGATDLADQGASPLLLQAKGRWASDIGRIYARMTRRAQLAASRLMQQRGARDLEELFPSFAQAA